MSNVEWKTRKFEIIIASAATLLVIILIVLLLRGGKRAEAQSNVPSADKVSEQNVLKLPFESLKIEYTKGNELSFSAEIEKEEMKKFFKEKGIDVPIVFSVLPKKLALSCRAKVNLISADGYAMIELLEMRINRIFIPEKLLSDIGELKLDFKRSLVYN